MTRRSFLAAAAATAASLQARPPGLLIDTHIHLFAADRSQFPLHPDAPYDPPAQDLQDYIAFVSASGPNHAVIVHPEPYQDDHSYLSHCLENEPWPGFFKGTCLFDPLDPEASSKMKLLASKHGGRIVAARVHAMDDPGSAPATDGPIKNRDLESAEMKSFWRAATDLGLAVQMHFRPHYAPQIAKLAAEFRDTPVILDHLGRSGMGTPEEYKNILALAKYPGVYMKFSGLSYSSKQGPPFLDAKPAVKQAFESFGPDRMIWGGIGYDEEAMNLNGAVLDLMFDYASSEDRAKIRGLTAKRLFRFEDV